MSKSYKIVAAPKKTPPMLGAIGKSLSSRIDTGNFIDGKGGLGGSTTNLPVRPMLELPANLAAVRTLDLLLGEDWKIDPNATEEEEGEGEGEERRKSIFDIIGEGLQNLFTDEKGPSDRNSSSSPSTVSAAGGAASAGAASEGSPSGAEEPKKPKKAKRDTPAHLPKIAGSGKKKDPRVSMVRESEEETEEWGEEEDDETAGAGAGADSAGGGEAAAVPKKKGKRDTPASLPKLPSSHERKVPAMGGFAEEEEEEWGDEDEEEDGATPADFGGASSAMSPAEEAAAKLAAQRASEEAQRAADAHAAEEAVAAVERERARALPMSGWLLKQSGGKLAKSGSIGNAMIKWDRRWFVLSGPSEMLHYYKAESDMLRGRPPAGSVEMIGSSLEQTGGGDGSFVVHTPSRVLTLKTEEGTRDVQQWARAMVAAGAYCEFELGAPSANKPRKSLRGSAPLPEASAKSEGSGHLGSGISRPSVTWAGGDPHRGHDHMPGMDGYLSKQARGGGAKWDRRYFVVPPGKTSLRYYKTREVRFAPLPWLPPERWLQCTRRLTRAVLVRASVRSRQDFMARREPAGAIDSARARLQVDRSAGSYILYLISADGQRSLALKAESASTLEHWVTALSSQGRATSVTPVDPAHAPLSPMGSPTGSAGFSSPGFSPRGGWDPRKPVKVLLLGDAGVGKTSVLTRFSDGLFVSSTRATVGIDLKKSAVDLDGDGRPISLQVCARGPARDPSPALCRFFFLACRLLYPLPRLPTPTRRPAAQIWDTAGQEMFRSIIASYYRGANGVLLMFDLTRRHSFDALDGWLKEVRSKAPEGTPIILAGNKCDLPNRCVERAEAAAFAKQEGMQYIETSAASNVCINEAFVTIVAHGVGRADEVATLLGTAKITQAGAARAEHERPADVGVVRISQHHAKPSGGCAC